MAIRTNWANGEQWNASDQNEVNAAVLAAEVASKKNTANGYAGLDSTGKVATGQLGAGTAAAWSYLRGDRQWVGIPTYQQDIQFITNWRQESSFGGNANTQFVVITSDYATGGGTQLWLPLPGSVGLEYGRLTFENRSGINITINGNGYNIEGASSYLLKNGSRAEFFWGAATGLSGEWKVSDRSQPLGQVADLSIVVFGANTTRAAGTGDFPFGVKLQRAVTFTSVTYRVATADASGNLVVELRKNGVAVSGSSATIAAASQVAGGTVTGSWDFAEGDIITVQVTGVGTTPGKGLVADIKGLTA